MTPPSNDTKRRIPGNWVILVLAALAVLVPATVWITLRWGQGDGEGTALVWSDRADWPQRPVRTATLFKRGIGALLSTSQYRDIDFDVSEIEEEALARCRTLAEQMEAGEGARATGDAGSPSEAVRRELASLAEQHPQMFYPPYLLGTWHRLHGQGQQAAKQFEKAFALAPAALMVRYVNDASGEPVQTTIGTIELAFDRVEAGALNQDLALVYPRLVSDERGMVYLPVYATVIRAARLPEPAGYQVRYRAGQWFDFPGRYGTVRAQVLPRDGEWRDAFD